MMLLLRVHVEREQGACCGRLERLRECLREWRKWREWRWMLEGEKKEETLEV